MLIVNVVVLAGDCSLGTLLELILTMSMGARYTKSQLEVSVCDICHAELVDNENAESVRGSQDRMQRFNRQMRFIREGLRKSEDMVLPAYVASSSLILIFAFLPLFTCDSYTIFNTDSTSHSGLK